MTAKQFVSNCLLFGKNISKESNDLTFEKVVKSFKVYYVLSSNQAVLGDMALRKNLLASIVEADSSVLSEKCKAKEVSQYSSINEKMLKLSDEGLKYLEIYNKGIVKYGYESILFETALQSKDVEKFFLQLLVADKPQPESKIETNVDVSEKPESFSQNDQPSLLQVDSMIVRNMVIESGRIETANVDENVSNGETTSQSSTNDSQIAISTLSSIEDKVREAIASLTLSKKELSAFEGELIKGSMQDREVLDFIVRVSSDYLEYRGSKNLEKSIKGLEEDFRYLISALEFGDKLIKG